MGGFLNHPTLNPRVPPVMAPIKPSTEANIIPSVPGFWVQYIP